MRERERGGRGREEEEGERRERERGGRGREEGEGERREKERGGRGREEGERRERERGGRGRGREEGEGERRERERERGGRGREEGEGERRERERGGGEGEGGEEKTSHIKERLPNTYRGIDCQVVRGRHLFIKIIITLEEFVITVLNIRPRIITIREGRRLLLQS